MAALTRRQALAAGGAAVALAGFGFWGRFALGGTFEEHVAEQLGLDRQVAEAVLRRMRDEVSDYEVRATGFLLATQEPSSLVLPSSVRRDAVDAFVSPMFGLSEFIVMPLLYSGIRDSVEHEPCNGLRRP
jgi:hypothetical protein